MPVKLIENAQKKGPSETGVKIIKNVTPHQGLMVLYREPKKVNVGRSFRKAFTWGVEVWVIRAQFKKDDSKAEEFFGIDNYYYGCVKEKHDSLWVSNNGINRIVDANFFSIDEMINVTDVPARTENKGPAKKCRDASGPIPCPPQAVNTVYYPAHKKITYNVSLRKGDVFMGTGGGIASVRNNIQTPPNKSSFEQLLTIYNEHNTNNKTISVQPNDEQTF